MRNLRTHSAESLLRLHYGILDELKRRGIIQNATTPIGEYAELLFCEAFGWTRAENVHNPGFDATDRHGARIQIKARRLVGNGSRQLGFRDLRQKPFDKLAAVLFAKNLDIFRAAIVPLEVVMKKSVTDPSGCRFVLEDAIWNIPTVQDVTDRVRLAATESV